MYSFWYAFGYARDSSKTLPIPWWLGILVGYVTAPPEVSPCLRVEDVQGLVVVAGQDERGAEDHAPDHGHGEVRVGGAGGGGAGGGSCHTDCWRNLDLDTVSSPGILCHVWYSRTQIHSMCCATTGAVTVQWPTHDGTTRATPMAMPVVVN